MNVITARLFNAYGPGELPGQYRNVIPNFIKLALEGKSLTITGDGTETRDFTYVSDTVRALHDLMFSPAQAGEVFNISGGQENSIFKVAQLINSYMGNNAEISYLPRRGWDSVTHRRGNTEKLVQQINFKPDVSLEQGISRTCEWIKEQYSC